MQVTISGQGDFPEDLQADACVLALSSPRFDPPSKHAPSDALHLLMEDVFLEDESIYPPQDSHLEQLFKYLDDKQPRHLHVACWMGVSRSTALAAAALAYRYPEMTDNQIAHSIYNIRHIASPNPRILRLTDMRLGRNLIKAFGYEDDWEEKMQAGDDDVQEW